MNVGQIIEFLKSCDPQAPVYFGQLKGGHLCNVTDAYLEEDVNDSSEKTVVLYTGDYVEIKRLERKGE